MTTVLQWIGSLLKWIDGLTGSYMITLFIFALLVEIVMLPLAFYQQKNSIKQARLRPKEMAIKKKYAGRTDNASLQKMREETQMLYQKEGFNQFAGCLPMLLQLPIVIALYNVVINPLLYVMRMSSNAISALQCYVTTAVDKGGLGIALTSNRGTIEYISLLKEKGYDFFSGLANFVDSGSVEAMSNFKGHGAEYMGELKNAFDAGLPNLNFFGVNLGTAPSNVFQDPHTLSNWLLLLVPVITFVVYYFSMKLTRKLSYQAPTAENADVGCSMKIMDFAMPALSTYFAFIVPAAVGIYWVFRSVVGTLKQFIMLKVMPFPQFTEEDYKAAEREIAGKSKRRTNRTPAERAESSGEKPRSLHHIDDEDADDYAEAVKRSLSESTELSKKSPYHDGPDDDNDSDADGADDKDSTESNDSTDDNGNGIIEKLPMKDDKNKGGKKKK